MKKLINYRPITFLAILMSLAIISAYAFYFNKIALGIFVTGILVFGVAVFTVTATKNEKLKNAIIKTVLYIFVCAFVFVSFTVTVKNYDNADNNGHYYTVTGRISKINEQDSYTSVVLDDLVLTGVNGGKSDYKMIVYIYGDCEYVLGDTISFSNSLEDRTTVFDGNFSSSNVSEGIKYTTQVNVNEITYVSNDSTVFEKVNTKFKKVLSNNLERDEFSVAYALLTGDSSFIDGDLLSSFRFAGVSHIFAVSGLHIGFLATFFSFLFRKLPVKKSIKAFIITLILFFYSGICGFSASSLRASIMISLYLFSKTFGYKYDNLSSISLAQVIILLFSPLQLFCAGFVLSFGVVYGLILLSGPLSKLLGFLPKKVALSVSSVIVAQMVSIPLSLLFFKQFSLFSFIANVVFLPVVEIIFIMLLLSVILTAVFSFSWIMIPAGFVIKIVNYVVAYIDYKPFIISGITFGVFSIFYYTVLVISSGVINLKKTTKIISAISLSLIFVAGASFTTINENEDLKVYVSGSKTASYVYFEKEDKNMLVITDINDIFSTYTFGRLLKHTNLETVDRLVVLPNGKQPDLQIISTKLLTVFKEIKQIIYYGEEDISQEKVMNKTFPKIACSNLCTDESVTTEFGTVEYKNDGYGLTVTGKEKDFLLFGRFGKSKTGYGNIEGDFDFVSVYDYAENIFSLYRADTFVTYRTSEEYANGEKRGILLLKM